MPDQKQDKGTGQLATGAGVTAYGAANAPILRGGSKDMSRMQNASPKKQGGRYQAELHQAMKAGKVPTESTVHVLRTPSGRHINAGGTHRKIARDAMGKPSKYEVKDISHEMHVSPATKLAGKLRVAGLARGSKRAEAGKKVKPVGTVARAANRGLASAADAGDAHVWAHPSQLSFPMKLNRISGLVGAGTVAGAGAITAGVGAHKRHEWKKTHPVSKARVMSDTEIKRRKKIQGHISQTTSTMGLAGLGVTGAAALAARKTPGGAKVLRGVRKIPGLKNTTPEKMKNAAINTGIVSGGVSGVGGFNFASYTGAESKKRTMNQPKQPVTKQHQGLEMGYFGEEGHPVELPEIVVPIEKAWSPSASNFNSEKSRGKRNQAYGGAALGAAGAGATYAGIHGTKAVKAGKKLRNLETEDLHPRLADTKRKVRATKTKPAYTKPVEHYGSAKPAYTAEKISQAVKPLKHHGGKALLGAGVAGGALYGAKKIKDRHESDWSPYAKRDAVSAFGIDHAH